jgi:hypothetical protein
MLAWIVGAVLLLWLICSAVNQFSLKWFSKHVTQYDHFMLLPRWTFFAPNPGCTDYRLLYRNYDEDERPSEWCEVPVVRRRSLLDALWNPDKRRSKGIYDLVQSLMQIRRDIDEPAVLMTSIPYVALAHFIDQLPRDENVQRRQFIIVQTHGIYAHAGPDVLITSGVHLVSQC